MFEVGEKVVCVNNKHINGENIKGLEINKTYTISTSYDYFVRIGEINNTLYPIDLFVSTMKLRILKLKQLNLIK